MSTVASSRRLPMRIVCSSIAFVTGFGAVWVGLDAPTSDKSSNASTNSAATPTEAPRSNDPQALARHVQAREPDEVRASGADGDRCEPERQATLEYAVRAARAEVLTRYGRPPATSLQPPTDEEIAEVFPDALASVVSCEPPPCRLAVATYTELEDFRSIPEQWGYPYGEVRAGSGIDKVLVYEFAFVGSELSPHEWKFLRNAWISDREHLNEMLLALRDAGDE